MNEISIPYQLFIPFFISILILGIIFYRSHQLFKIGKWRWYWISLTLFFAIYISIVGGAIYIDIYAQWNLNNFDLNKDGLFSGEEITPEQEMAVKTLTNDTGRNFSFITGLIFSGIIAFFVLVIGRTTEYIKNNT